MSPNPVSKMNAAVPVSARIKADDYTDLATLITVGIYDNKSDAIRELLSIGIQSLRDNEGSLIAYYKATLSFDEDMLACAKDPVMVDALLDRIEELRPLFNYELRYRIEKRSDLLDIARCERKHRETTITESMVS